MANKESYVNVLLLIETIPFENKFYPINKHCA